jgi:hypothetical protein
MSFRNAPTMPENEWDFGTEAELCQNGGFTARVIVAQVYDTFAPRAIVVSNKYAATC